ncbi:myosin-2 isoform X1 [Capsicum annuum]|uniref:myosin-2 isoform X1 n=1 Tax=Capsicum annuum TaxID=4072 RepID=UPI001FB14FCF|nr:myosin-2 isoform X1 [Capsicum annuum]
MDLGCFDMGCIEKKPANESMNSPTAASTTATSKLGKAKAVKEGGQSNLVSLNKSGSQIRKPPHRKTSPLNWFPRKKVDSYLKRKIKMLQEVDGMNSTLDETLGDANPHYCRVLREKIAVREAAQRAVETRKAALIEASWCRILQAARIDCKEAEQLLIKAENFSAEAFEAATAIGVILFDIPDCSRKHYKIEKSPAREGGPTTHTVRTSFETAFEVDKQVASAVKAALRKLANCPSMNKDEVKELLHRISQNPETDDNHQEVSEFSSECESDTASEVADLETEPVGVKERKYKKKQAYEKFNMPNLVEMMLERLRCLQEDELASLATIVATCGLNAALAEAENSKPHISGSAAVGEVAVKGYNLDGKKSKTAEELPSLDKFLVKRLTRFERDVLEAKNARSESGERSEQSQDKSADKVLSEDHHAHSGHDLASILKKSEQRQDKSASSKLEKEIEEAKNNSETLLKTKSKVSNSNVHSSEVPSLDKFLVKRLTRLEREVLEAKNARTEAKERSEQRQDKSGDTLVHSEYHTNSGHDLASILKKPSSSKFEKEIEEAKNNSEMLLKTKCKASNSNVLSSELPDLSSVLVKHSSKLEKDIEEAKRKNEKLGEIEGKNSKRLGTVATGQKKKHEIEVPSLEDYLVKPMTRLEREVQEAKSRENTADSTANVSETTSLVGKENVDQNVNHDTSTVGNSCNGEHPSKSADTLSIEVENKESPDSLDNIIVKPVCRFQRTQRKFEANSATDSEGLDKILVKHVSKLEKEKMSFHAKEEDNLMNVKKRDTSAKQLQHSEGSLDQILVKHKSRLEREKMAASQPEDDYQIRDSTSRKATRERELQEAWGGLSLGKASLDQILVKHKSRLEREKMAASQPGDDDQIRHSISRKATRERELQEAWGGLSLGNSLRPHMSRLQRDKAAWLKAEEEERKGTVEA